MVTTRPRIFNISPISLLDGGFRQTMHTQEEQLKEAQDDLNRLLEFTYVSRTVKWLLHLGECAPIDIQPGVNGFHEQWARSSMYGL